MKKILLFLIVLGLTMFIARTENQPGFFSGARDGMCLFYDTVTDAIQHDGWSFTIGIFVGFFFFLFVIYSPKTSKKNDHDPIQKIVEHESHGSE